MLRPIQIQLTLFGDWQLTLDNTPIKFATDHARALFAYLAVESGQHDRSSLAALLWPEQPEAAARQNLRQTLLYLKQALRDFPQVAALLEITTKTLRLYSTNAQIDVQQFRQLWATCAAHTHQSMATCAACNARLQQAAALYEGEFLKSLFIKNSEPFEEWALFVREQLHRQALGVFHTLTLYTESVGQYEQMQHYATRQLALEPWREAAHRQIMAAFALAGQETAALMHYATCRRILQEELGASPSTETTALYEQIRQGKFHKGAGVRAQLAEQSVQEANLPQHLPNPRLTALSLPLASSPLLGRAAELTQITNLLTQPTCRWLTLVGPPGVGKTRLAQAIAAQQQPNFADGVYFVDLAISHDPALVLVAIAAALGVREQDTQPLAELLRLSLQDKGVLLLLDNFEQVWTAAPALAQLLSDCPGLNVLITSRSPLRVAEEQLYAVQPLALPEPAQLTDLATFMQIGAVQLFVERATVAKPDFQLTTTNAVAVAALCLHLDGLPLAIELAAARSRLFSPAALLARLQQRLPLLVNREPNTPMRHQTLRGAIDWSYDLLTPGEQRLFQRLAVFSGGFTLEAAERVMANQPLVAHVDTQVDRTADGTAVDRALASAVIDGVESLLDKNLLRLQTLLPYGQLATEDEPRFTMLETLREYALARLADAGTAEPHEAAAQARHAHFFLALAEEAAPQLFGAAQLTWLNRLEVEHDNLRAAQDWFAQQADAPSALRLAVALRYFWRVRGYYSEGCARLQRALPWAASTHAASALRAAALNAAGYLEWVRGDRHAAQALLDEALLVGKQVADPRAIAFALRYLGVIADAEGDTTTAQTLLEESLQRYRQIDGKNDLALSLLYLGDVAMAQQKYEQARSLYEECAALLRVLQNKITLPYALRRLGYLALWRDAIAEARVLGRESLQINLTLGEQQGVAASLVALAAIACASNRFAAGVQLLGLADTLLTTRHTQLLPFDEAQQNNLLAQARSQLDAVTFAEAWVQGQGIAFTAITAFVDQLAEAVQPTPTPTIAPNAVNLSPAEERVRSIGLLPKSSLIHASLPAALTPFVGRAREISEILARLQLPDLRLLTLVGPGGMGKTRLAVEAVRLIATAAASQPPWFADGVFFVSLASLSNPSAMAPAILNTLGLNLAGADPRQTLLQFLRGKQVLLLLDNFEHLLPTALQATGSTTQPDEAVALVSDLLQATPGVSILVTSRERLNLRSEHLYGVQPLAFSLQANLADAVASAAVHLFSQSARRVAPSFMVTEAHLPALLRICHLVQGIPLGLEMAAAWTDQLTLAEIAQEIEKSGDFLTFAWHDAPARQRSMRAVFEWSWRLLTPAEQQVLRQLAIFRGGFTRAAATTITGTSLRVLVDLVNKSLLQRYEVSAEAPEVRYELHELLRQFAHEKLDAVLAERSTVEAQHSHFYLTFVATREQRLARNEQISAVAEIQREIDNVRQAWSWTVAQGPLDDLATSMYSLLLFYTLTTLFSEGSDSFEVAIQHLQTRLRSATNPDQRQSYQQTSSKLLALRAFMLVPIGKYDEARQMAEQALAIGETDPVGEAATMASLVLGQVSSHKGDYAQSRASLTRALVLAQEYQKSSPARELFYDVEFSTYIWLGYITLRQQSAHEQARAYTEQSLKICRQLGKVRGEILCLLNLAWIAIDASDYVVARAYEEQAVQIARDLGYHLGEGVTQSDMSEIVRLQGDYGLAYRLTTDALIIIRELGELREECYALSRLCRLSIYMGDYGRAHAFSEELNRTSLLVALPETSALARLPLALLYYQEGEYQQAITLLMEGIHQSQEFVNPNQQAEAFVIIGHAQVGLGQFTEAATAYQQALTLYAGINNVYRATEARAGLARIALARAELAQAQALAEDVLAVLTVHPLAGLDEPFFNYLTCYTVLRAAQDPRALRILQIGYQVLQTYADHVPDTALRHTFLENVAVHRALVTAYEQEMPMLSPQF